MTPISLSLCLGALSKKSACRVTPIIFTPVPMELVASDLLHDYWQVIVDSPYNRVYYYFELKSLGIKEKSELSKLFWPLKETVSA